MTDPRRLADDPALRDVIRSAAGDDDPASLARVSQAIAAEIGAGPDAWPTEPVAGAGATGLAGAAGKIFLLGGAGLLIAGAIWAATTAAPTPRPAPPEADHAERHPAEAHADELDAPVEHTLPEAPPAQPPPAEAPFEEPPSDAPSSSTSSIPASSIPEPGARPARADSTSSSDAPSFAEELALLQRMRSALAVDPEEALRLAEEHRRRFARGQLTVERERLTERARAALGSEPR